MTSQHTDEMRDEFVIFWDALPELAKEKISRNDAEFGYNAATASALQALHFMDEILPISDRVFTDNNTYCSVVEPSGWNINDNGFKEVNYYSKTHIVFHKSAMSEHCGLQIIRFGRAADEESWRIASNPWSGVYLTPDEWGIVMRKALTAPLLGAMPHNNPASLSPDILSSDGDAQIAIMGLHAAPMDAWDGGDLSLLDPDMPDQELRLHMGELSGSEIAAARAAIRWANSKIAKPLQSNEGKGLSYDTPATA